MFRSRLTRQVLFFVVSLALGVALGAAIGGTVGYPTEWTATGGTLGVAVSVLLTRH